MRFLSLPLCLCLATLASIARSYGAEPLPTASVRDQAGGVEASLATPATGAALLDPSAQDDAMLEESLRYQMEQQKKWKLRVFASGAWRHDSNVNLSDKEPKSDNMWSARPGFQYSYGDADSTLQFLADGALEFNYFDKFADQNTINKFLSASLTYRLKKTTFKFNGRFTDVSGGDLDVGGQAQRVQFTPQLEVTYDATEKIRFGLSSQMNRSDYQSLLSSTTYRYGAFADYAFSPLLRVGMQVNQMTQDVTGSGRQTGQDYLVRMELELFKKLTATGSLGVSMMHPISGRGVTLPVGAVGFRYALGPKTSINASVYARSQSSPSLEGQYFQSNGAMIGIQQQVGSKLNLGADVGVDHSTYRSYLGQLVSAREDSLYFVRPWVKYTLSRRLALELFYQYTTNASKGTGARDFDRDLYGIGVTTSW